MKGYQIFLHSVKQVLGNFGPAIRISGILFLVQMIVMFAVGRSGVAEAIHGAQTMEPRHAGLTFLMFLVTLVSSLWIAVAWHRYILRVEEPQSILPAFHGQRLLAYLGYSLLIGLIMIIPAILLSMVAGMLATAGGMIGVLLGLLVMLVPIFLLTLRLCAALPAAALGEPLGLRGAWDATQGATVDFLVLAIIAGVASFILDLPMMVLGMPLAMGWGVISAWLKTMVGASILTTIYGHYVERRPLAE